MDALHIQPSSDSVILAFGTTENPRSRRYWLWTILLLGCLLGFLAFLWGMLNRPIQIPSRTALLISLSPKSAKELPNSIRDTLPLPWKNGLLGSSRWPSILGTYRTETGWESFAIVPSWFGSHRLIQDSPFSSSSRDFRMAEAWSWSVWLDPRHVFFDEVPSEIKLESFTASWDDRSLLTNLSMAQEHAITSLVDADISFQRNRDGSVWSILDGLDTYRELIDAVRKSGAEPSVVSGSLSSSGTLQSLFIQFFDPLNEEQASIILSGARLDDRRVKTLDDGVVVLERVGLSSSSGTLFRTYEQSLYGEVALQPNALLLNRPSFEPLISRCPGAPVVHVSALTLQSILKSVGVQTKTDIDTALTLSEDKGKLRICFE